MAEVIDTATLWLMKLTDAFRPLSEALLDQRLARAQKRGREGHARYLLGKGANPDLLAGGVPLIVKAAHDRQPWIVGALIEHGANVNAADSEGTTALMSAAIQGDLRTGRLLMNSGADVTCRNAFNYSAFDYAEAAVNWDGTLEWTLRQATEAAKAKAAAKAAAAAAQPEPEPEPFIADVTTAQPLNLSRPLRLKTGTPS